ncbi:MULTISPECIES: LexA family protein [Acinetobacter]|uniref:LexA family protein n=1 Tax=Acinetobacter TaxID=469 RepID=UPI00054CC858|nr:MULTISPECIES: S24 family peptidase [Acinetobacter]
MDIISLRRANLRQAIDAKIKSEGFSSDAAFCEHYDLNPSHISQLVKGHGSFGERAARNLERKVGWEVGLLDREPTKNIFGEETLANVPRVKARMAPVLSWVQAGNFTNVAAVDMSQVSQWLPLPEDECSNCFFLRVQGISNFPDFIEGDYIVVNPDVYYGDMQSGDIIVVRRGDDATFKKLVIETNGKRYLQALNPDFKPNTIEFDEECQFVGQVVDCVRYVYHAKPRLRKN